MFSRRQFMGVLPASAVAITAAGSWHEIDADDESNEKPVASELIASPPVVQNPRANRFGVSIAVNQLATAWVEYGFAADDLRFTAMASHHGLVQADNRALHIRVHHGDNFPTDRPIFYRVVAQPLRYISAYQLERGKPQATKTLRLPLPHEKAPSIRVVSINDTHENTATITRLHEQIETLAPHGLIWNGDTCNDFNAPKSTEQILLNPAQSVATGWASERPLLFSNGNHDVRGERAREVARSLAGCPESADLPYNQALRWGPLAIITLDTGEDKPDRHPVFAGTAAYEPYRQQQAAWLKQVVAAPAIASAPFKIAICHIPLRGLEGQPNGTTLEGYARYSGFGAKLWLPTLEKTGFNAILSGHTHSHRLDEPTDNAPVSQFVGGGPQPEKATLTIIDANQTGDQATLTIRIIDLAGKMLHKKQWVA